MKTPTALIAIPTFRRPAMLKRLLLTLVRQNGIDSTVIGIVDNSPDQSAASLIAEFRFDLSIVYRHEPRPGVVHGRNALLTLFYEVGAEALIFLDDDELPHDDWLFELLASAVKYPDDVLSGRIVFTPEVPVADSFVREFYVQRSQAAPDGAVTTTGTGNTLIPLRALERAQRPRFDPRYQLIGGEDSDFFDRLKSQGISVRSSYRAVVDEIVPLERCTRRWIIDRSIRSGYIRGKIIASRSSNIRVVVGGIGRIVYGSLLVPIQFFRFGRVNQPSLASVLSGIGMVRSLIWPVPTVYGRDS